MTSPFAFPCAGPPPGRRSACRPARGASQAGQIVGRHEKRSSSCSSIKPSSRASRRNSETLTVGPACGEAVPSTGPAGQCVAVAGRSARFWHCAEPEGGARRQDCGTPGTDERLAHRDILWTSDWSANDVCERSRSSQPGQIAVRATRLARGGAGIFRATRIRSERHCRCP